MKRSMLFGATTAAALLLGSAAFAESGGFDDADRQQVYQAAGQHYAPGYEMYPQSYESTGSIYAPRQRHWRRVHIMPAQPDERSFDDFGGAGSDMN